MRKKIISFILTFAIVLALCGFASAETTETSFSDVSNSSYIDAIDVLTTLKFINGFPDGTFRPNDTLSRAQAVTIITKAIYGNNTQIIEALDWADVSINHWARANIDTAYIFSIVNGYGNQKFGPEDNVTYAQFVTMLLNSLGYQVSKMLGTWPDNAVVFAQELGIFNQLTINDYNKNCSREEAAQMFFNCLDIMNKNDIRFLESIGYEEIRPTVIKKGENMGKGLQTFKDETGEKYFTHRIVTSDGYDATFDDGKWIANGKGLDEVNYKFYNGKQIDEIDEPSKSIYTAIATFYKGKPFALVVWEAKTYWPFDGLNYGGFDTSKLVGFKEGVSVLTIFDENNYKIANDIRIAHIDKVKLDLDTDETIVTLSDKHVLKFVDEIIPEGANYAVLWCDVDGNLAGYRFIKIK